ncbi:minor capsid protein [Candidatus Pacearchaeota archaeon]|jgi:hypothetical protein|nr:minor capsid protein [Candidatus Pacearchaeota archaeon]
MSVNARLEWKGDQIAEKVRKQALEGLFDGAEFILEEANRIVPHDEGTLEISGETSIDTDKMEAAVSYDTPYAKRLHEHPEYNFQNGREGKWLEKTVNEQAEVVRDMIADRVKIALEG